MTTRDGRDNGWEYFTGTDPQEARHYADFEIQLVTDKDGEHYLSGHVLVNPSAPVLSNMIPELSHDLIEWQSDPRLFEGAALPFEFWPGLGWRMARPVSRSRGSLPAGQGESRPARKLAN